MLSFNKILLYVALIIVYLSLSKALSPAGLSIEYVFNKNTLAQISLDKPLSVILVDAHSTGFAIKTHYHKYRLVHGFRSFEEKIVKVSYAFKENYAPFIGSSIFRRNQSGEESFEILIPGSVYIGEPTFGRWIVTDNDQKVWRFHRAYKHLRRFLGWGDYQVTYEDYQKIQFALTQSKNYLGKEDVFSTNGLVSRTAFPSFYRRQRPNKIDFKTFLKDYFKENFYQSKVDL